MSEEPSKERQYQIGHQYYSSVINTLYNRHGDEFEKMERTVNLGWLAELINRESQARISAIKECAEIASTYALSNEEKAEREKDRTAKMQGATAAAINNEILSLIEAEEGK